MKVKRVSEKEIDRLGNLLGEIQAVTRYYEYEVDYFDAFKLEILKNPESFPVFCRILPECDSKDEFYRIVLKELSATRFEMIITNLHTLIENCADLDSDTLDFNKKIKDGFAALKKK